MTLTNKKSISMRDTFSSSLLNLAQTDPRVYVLDGDLATSTKIDTIAEKCPNKFLQMGIAEQNMISVAAGLATTGLQPWVTTFAAFLSKRALDQIQVQVAQTKLDVKLIGAYSGLLTGLTGKSHQSLEDIAIFRTLANMIVLAPADATETASMINWANSHKGPVYIRLARDNYPIIFNDNYTFELGKGVVFQSGTDITIISTGTQTSRVLDTIELLKQQGISAEIIHLPSIKPIDKDLIIKSAKKTGIVVTAEEHSIYGGLGSTVAEILSLSHPTPIEFVGIDERNSESASNEDLVNEYGLSPTAIMAAVKRALKRKNL